MARRDRTFTAQDIIRFYHENLTDSEATIVFEAICSRRLDLVPETGTVEFWKFIVELIDVIISILQVSARVPGSVGATSRVAIRALMIVRAFLNTVIVGGK